MNFAKFLRTPFYRTPQVAASDSFAREGLPGSTLIICLIAT